MRLTLLVAGVVGVVFLIVLVVRVAPERLASTDDLQGKRYAQARAEEISRVRTALLAAIAGLLATWGAVYTARSYALNRAGQITERFTRAIDQLGNKELDVRLGGIYALERIARESRDDHGPIMEILTAYVREHAPWPPKPPGEEPSLAKIPTTDVQAALTVVGRRNLAHEHGKNRELRLRFSWELSTVNLRRADLRNAHLERAVLRGARLERALLLGAHLEAADLRGAHLEGAHLNDAHLKKANLRGARYTADTVWPRGFSPAAAGAKLTADQTEPRRQTENVDAESHSSK